MDSTVDLLRNGIVKVVATNDSKKPAALFQTVPGEILFVLRPLSFFERLLYPLLKE